MIGVVEFPDFSTFLMADIPGLLDGAHRNIGLGHEFLRHIERTKALLYVLDMAGVDGRNPVDDLKVLQNELELYMKGLSTRAVIIVANKMDLPESADNLKVLKRKAPKHLKIIPLSAATDESFDKLKETIRDVLVRQTQNS